MKIKELPAHVKAMVEESAAGQFEAIVSVFGNVDSYGDVVRPGAFTETLAGWKASGNPIPVIWSHDWSDPFSHIGVVLDSAELQPGDDRLPVALKENGGLWIRGQIDLDNPKAVQVHRLMKGGRVTQFSFAYDIVEGGRVDEEDDRYYELRRLQLHEVGPCLVGANQETELLAVKAAAVAAGLKEGRVLAAGQVAKLKAAQAALAEIISATDEETSPDPGEKGADPAPSTKDDSRPETEPEAAAEAAADGSKSGAAHETSRVRNRIDLELDLLEFASV